MSVSDYEDLGLDDLVDEISEAKEKKKSVFDGIIQTTSFNTNDPNSLYAMAKRESFGKSDFNKNSMEFDNLSKTGQIEEWKKNQYLKAQKYVVSKEYSSETDQEEKIVSKKEIKKTGSIQNIFGQQQKQLLKVDQQGNVFINEQTLEYIKNIKQKIKVIGVVGPYWQGKSYLLNRFANSQKGFSLGPTTQPCTEGIWIWDIQESQNETLILLDTEGLYAYNSSEQLDITLFLLSSLLSSIMIYNTFGVIDEAALEKLSFVSELGQYFGYLENKSKLGYLDIQKYFPELIWVLWDFSLEQQSPNGEKISSKEYLEQCLQVVPEKYQSTMVQSINKSWVESFNEKGSKELIRNDSKILQNQKNKIRESIKKTFVNRNCFTLERPIASERLIRNLDQVDYSQLNEQFKVEVNKLITYTLVNCKVKQLRGKSLDGQSYCEYIKMIVQGINEKKIPMVDTMWQQISKMKMEKMKLVLDKKMGDLKGQVLESNEVSISNLRKRLFKQTDGILKEAIKIDEDMDQQQYVFLMDHLFKQRDQLYKEIKSWLFKEEKNKINLKEQESIQQISSIQTSSLDIKQKVYKQIQFVKETIKLLYKDKQNQKSKVIEQLLESLQLFIEDTLREINQEQNELKSKNITLQSQLDTKQELLEQQKSYIVQQGQNQTSEKYGDDQLSSTFMDFEQRITSQIMTQLQEIKSGLVNKKQQNDQNQIQEIKSIKESLHILLNQMNQINNKLEETEQEKTVLSKQFNLIQEQIQNSLLKSQFDQQENLQSSQKVEKEFKQKLQDMESISNQQQLLLVRKDAEIWILTQKIQSEDKVQRLQKDYSKTLCDISEQIMYLLKKLER